MALQKLLIRYFLEPLSRLMGKMPDKGRRGLFYVAGSGIFIYFFLNHMSVIPWRYLYSFALCSVMVAVMILATLPKKIKPVRFNPLFTVCWLGVGGLMLLSGVINNSDYLSEAFMLLVAYPIIYICWNNWDTESAFRLLLKLCKISLLIFFVVSFALSQITAQRFSGLFNNVNNCACYLALAGICLLVEIFYEHGSVIRNIVNILLLGMCYGMIDLTNSRTGKLALLSAAVIGFVVYCITYKIWTKKGVIASLLACVLLGAVMSTYLLGAFQMRQYLPLPYYDRDTHSFYFVGGVDADDPNAPGGSVETITMDSFEQISDAKNSMEGKTFDQYTSGRVSIWLKAVKRLKLFGVDKKQPVLLDGCDGSFKTTHMTVLEIAYESGIFAGVFYLLVNLLSGILAIIYAWRHRGEKFAVMPLMVILAFGVVSVTSSVNSSYNYILTFYYYLVLFPLIVKGQKSPANQ